MEYGDGSICGEQQVPIISYLNIKCDGAIQELVIDEMEVTQDLCQYTFMMRSKYACNSSTDSGIDFHPNAIAGSIMFVIGIGAVVAVSLATVFSAVQSIRRSRTQLTVNTDTDDAFGL